MNNFPDTVLRFKKRHRFERFALYGSDFFSPTNHNSESADTQNGLLCTYKKVIVDVKSGAIFEYEVQELFKKTLLQSHHAIERAWRELSVDTINNARKRIR